MVVSQPKHILALANRISTFEPGVTTLAIKFIPSFATRKTRQAHALLVGAFTKYFSAGYPEEASNFMKARYEHIVKHQITDIEDVAKLEVTGAFSIITNSAPCAFWLLYHIVRMIEIHFNL